MKLYDKIVRPTTQMLLKRMDENPEDFDTTNASLIGGKSWLAIAKHGEFNWYERRLIHRRAVAIRRKSTEQRILELLLDGEARQNVFHTNISQHSTVGRFTGDQQLSIDTLERVTEKLQKI